MITLTICIIFLVYYYKKTKKKKQHFELLKTQHIIYKYFKQYDKIQFYNVTVTNDGLILTHYAYPIENTGLRFITYRQALEFNIVDEATCGLDIKRIERELKVYKNEII